MKEGQAPSPTAPPRRCGICAKPTYKLIKWDMDADGDPICGPECRKDYILLVLTWDRPNLVRRQLGINRRFKAGLKMYPELRIYEEGPSGDSSPDGP